MRGPDFGFRRSHKGDRPAVHTQLVVFPDGTLKVHSTSEVGSGSPHWSFGCQVSLALELHTLGGNRLFPWLCATCRSVCKEALITSAGR